MGIEDLTKEAAATLRDMMAMSAMSGMVCGEWMPSEETPTCRPLSTLATIRLGGREPCWILASGRVGVGWGWLAGQRTAMTPHFGPKLWYGCHGREMAESGNGVHYLMRSAWSLSRDFVPKGRGACYND